MLLAAVDEEHRSAASFVSQLVHSVLLHHSTQPLAFLSALDASAAAAPALAALAEALGPFQLDRLLDLTSVQTALSGKARSGGDKAAQQVREQLPGWLAAQRTARRHRRTALLCVLELAAELFPGANRTTTSARALYAELASGRPSRQWRSVAQTADKLRCLGAAADARLRRALQRCAAHLQPDQDGATSPAAAGLHTLLRGAAPAPPAAAAPASAESRNGWSAAKRRKAMLGPGAGEAASSHELAAATARWVEAEICVQIDAPRSLPLDELWQHGAAEAAALVAASAPAPTRAFQHALEAVLKSGGAKRARPAQPVSVLHSLAPSQRPKRARGSAVDSSAAAAVRAALGQTADEPTPPPTRGGPRAAKASKPDAGSAAGSSKDDARIAAPERGLALVDAVAPLAEGGVMPTGWAVAAAFDVLRTSADRSVGLMEAFEAFETHAVAKQAARRLGLDRRQIAAHFVLASQELDMSGFAKVGSKSSRGVLNKLVL